jgi:plastocyanin
MSVALGNYFLFGNYDTSYAVMNQVRAGSSYAISGISSDGKNMISYQGTYPNYNTYYSNNYGQTWLLSDMPTSNLGNYCTPLNYPNVFYVGAINGTDGSGKLYRSLNGGANWSLISNTYGNISGLCVNDDDTILYLSNYNNAVYYSARTGNSSFNYSTNAGTFTFNLITGSSTGNPYYGKILCNPTGSILYGTATSSNFAFKYTYSDTSSFTATLASSYNSNVIDIAMSSNGSYKYASLYNNANYTIVRSIDDSSFTDIGTSVITKNIAAFVNCDPTGRFVQVNNAGGAGWWVSNDYGNTFSLYGGNAIPSAPSLGPNNRFYLLVNNTTTLYGPAGAPIVPSFSDSYWIRGSEPYALPDTNPGTLKESYRTSASTAITFPSLTSDISNVKFVVSNGNAAVARLTTGNAVIVGTPANGGSPSQTVKDALNFSKNVIKIVCNDTAFCAIYTPSGETRRRLIHWGYYGSTNIETIGNNNMNFNNISNIQSKLNLVDISDIAVNQSCAFAALDTSGVVYSWGDKIAGGSISDSLDLSGASGGLSTLLAGTDPTFGLCSRLISGQKHFGVISSSGRGVVWGDKSSSSAFPVNKWLAVANSPATGGTVQIAYSSNGLNWTLSSNANSIFGSVEGRSVVAHNGKVWVVGVKNAASKYSIGYSYDGNTWFGSTSGNSIMTSVVGVEYGNGMFVAVGGGGTHTIMYSTDGINWVGSVVANPISGWIMGIVYRNSTWVIFGGTSVRPATNIFATSTNAINWTASTTTNMHEIGGIDYNGTNWVLVGTGTSDSIMYTTNINGALASSGLGNIFSLGRAHSVFWSGSRFIVVGRNNSPTTTTPIYYSDTGASWTVGQSVSSTKFNKNGLGIQSVKYLNNIWLLGQEYQSGSATSNLLYSTDNGLTWNDALTNAFSVNSVVWSVGFKPPESGFIYNSAITGVDDILMATDNLHNCIFMRIPETTSPYSVSVSNINASKTVTTQSLFTGLTTKPRYTTQRMGIGRTTALITNSLSEYLWVYLDNAKRLITFGVTTGGTFQTLTNNSTGLNYQNIDSVALTQSVITFSGSGELYSFATQVDANVTNSITNYKDIEERVTVAPTLSITPALYYTFDSATISGSTIQNLGSTSTTHNLTLNYGAGTSSSIIKHGNRSLDLSGTTYINNTAPTATSQAAYTTSAVSLSNSTKFSISFWFYITGRGSTYPMILYFGSYSLGRIYVGLNNGITTQVGNRLTIGHTSDYADLESVPGIPNTDLTFNTWHYFGWSVSGGTWEIRLDGNTSTLTGKALLTTNNFATAYIGVGPDGPNSWYRNFSGYIENYRFFNGSLTANDLTNLYNERTVYTPGILKYNLNRQLKYNPSSQTVIAYGSGTAGTTALTETYTNAVDVYTGTNTFAVSQTTPSLYTLVEAITNSNQKYTISKPAGSNIYFGSSGKGLYALEIPNNPKLSPKIIPPSITRTITYYVSNPDLAAEKWSTYVLSASGTSVVQVGSTYTTYDNISNTYAFTGVSLPTIGKNTLYIWNTVPDICYNVLQFDLSVSIVDPVTPSAITLTHISSGVINIAVTQTSPPESYFAAGISYYYYQYTTGTNYSGDVSYYTNLIGDVTDETYPVIKKTISGLSSETFTFYVRAKSSITGVSSTAISQTITLRPVSPNSLSVSMSGTNAIVTVTDTNNFTTNNITYWYYAYKTSDVSNNSNDIAYYTSVSAFTSSPTVFTIPGLDADATYFIYVIARNTDNYSAPVVGYETNTNIILSDRYDNYKSTPYVFHDKNPGTIRDTYRTNATGITFPSLTSDISNVKFVVSNGNAAVVRLVTGNAVVVGAGLNGGKPSQTVKNALNNSTNVIKIVCNDNAFCAIYVPSGQTRRRVIHWGHYGLSNIETIGTGNANFNNISTVDASLNLTDISDIAMNSAGAFVALNASGQIYTWGDKRGGGDILNSVLTNGSTTISTWLTGKTFKTISQGKFHFGAIDTSQNGIIWGVRDPSSSYLSGGFHTATTVQDFYFTNTQSILCCGFITWGSNNVNATYNTISTTTSVQLITGLATTLPTFTLQRMNGGRTTSTAIPSTSEVWTYLDNGKRLRMFLVSSAGVPTLYSGVTDNSANFFSATPSVLTYKSGNTLTTFATTVDANVTNSITNFTDVNELTINATTSIAPMIYYTFESATSSVVTNMGASGSAYNLTLYGGANISTTIYKYGASSVDLTGITGGALLLTDPNLKYARASNTVSVTNSANISFSTWVYITSATSAYGFFVHATSGGTDRVYIHTNTTGNITFGVKTTQVTSSATISFNTWTYIGWSINGTTWIYRVNGTQQSGTFSPGTIPNTFTYFVLGVEYHDSTATANKSCNLYVDNFRFFNGSLTAQDLTNLYNEGPVYTPGFLNHNYNRLLKYKPSSSTVVAYGSGTDGTTALTETYTNATDIYTSANAFVVSQTTPSQYTIVEAITNANQKANIAKTTGRNVYFGPSGKGLYAVDVSNNPILSPKIIPINVSRTISYYVSNPDLAANRWSTYALSTSSTSLVQVGKTYSVYDNISSTYTFTDVSFTTIGNKTLYIRNIDPDLSYNVTQFDLSVATITPVAPSTLTLTQLTPTSIRITVTQTSPPESYFAAGIGYYYYQYTTGTDFSGVDASYSNLIGMITDETYPAIQSTVSVVTGTKYKFYVRAKSTTGGGSSTSISQTITPASSVPVSPNSVNVTQSGSNINVIITDASNSTTNGITYWYYVYKTTDVSNNSGNIGSYTEGPAFTSSPTIISSIPGLVTYSTYIIYVVARNILGDAAPVASSSTTIKGIPLAPTIDTGNTKSSSTGTISVSLLDTSNNANNGVYYSYLVGDISYNKSISFGNSSTAATNPSSKQIGIAITAPGTTRLAVFTYIPAGTGPTANKLYYARIVNDVWSFNPPSFSIAESSTFACAITPDARRLIISAGTFGQANHSIYWADATGLLSGASTSLTFTKINQSSTILCYYVAVSDDGNRIAVSESNGSIYYSDWSGNNYGPLQRTLDSARGYVGIYISPDKNKLVYASGANAYYALWNGTNYSVGTAIPGTAQAMRGLSVYKYGFPEEIVVGISVNQTSQYSVWNGSGYDPWISLSNTIPAINNWGLAIDSSGAMYYNAFDLATVYRTNVTSSSTMTSTFVNSGVQFTGTEPNNLYKLDVSGLTLNTRYKINVRAENSIGTSNAVSVSNLSVLGDKPVISSITPVSGLQNTLRVNFSQTYKGTTPVTYYYSRNADGSNRFSATDVSFVITDASQATTIYVIADNSAGTLISLGVSGTPYLLGSKPTIDSIVPSVGNTVTVNFTQTTLGSGTTAYYYGFAGSGVRTDASASTSPLIITGLNNTTQYSIYLVARNEAGDISSNAYPNVSVLGAKPVITGITKNAGNSLTVAFSQSQKGTSTVVYYYSLDGSNVRLDASASSSPITISGLTNDTSYNISIVARNPAGDVFSDASSGIAILGTTPTLTASQVANVDKTVRLTYAQTSKGTLPVTYYYTTDNSANTVNRFAFPTDSSTVDVSGVIGTVTYYAIADNAAGNVISTGASVTPNLIGSKPTLTAVPVLNSPGVVRVTYFQTTTGTTPVTYYYTTVSDVNTTDITAFPNGSSSVDLSGITGTTTYYVVAKNVAGNIISDGSSVTPYLLGSNPTIGTITVGTNQLSVAFSQDTLGTLPTRYYYSTNGTTKLGPGTTTSPLLITGISGPITFYLIADNSAGVVRSISTATATPYYLGDKPTVTSIVPNASIANSVIVNFTQSSVGNGTPVYYYGFAGSGVRLDASATTSPLVVTGLINTVSPYSIYVVARNEAGDISSNAYPNVNVLGVKPVITGVTKNIGNSITVAFSQSQKGTDTTVYNYSFDGSNVRLDASSSATSITIPNLISTSPYSIYLVARNPAGNVFSEPSLGVNILGTKPVITGITKNVGNSITVAFSQSQKGTDTTTYYGSLDGSNIIQDASSTGTSLTISNLIDASAYNIYIIARNPAGDIVSDASSGIHIFGTKPTISNITRNVGNTVTVVFSQSQKGTGTTTYYASTNGSTVLLDASSSGDSLIIRNLTDASAYTIYVIARNPAGDVPSDPSLNVSILGTQPSFTLVPQTNNLRGTITHVNKGTLPVNYYYSSDGINKDFEVSFPTFDISGTEARTFYIIAENSAGMNPSSPVSGTPYVFGDAPVISSVVPGSQVLTVNFSQQQTGTTPIKYYYSYDPSGTVRIGQVNPPSFDIVGTDPRTVYIVVDNSAGTLVSAGVSGTPYIFGSLPRITLIQRGSEKITVTYTQTDKGTLPVRYYYSFDRVNRIADVTTTATFDILYDVDSRIGNKTYNVAVSGGLYSFSGDASGNNPNITVVKGSTLTWNVNSPGHPFWIKTANVTGTDYAVTSNITNNGTQSGTIIWNTSDVNTGTYYYICQYHSSMVGSITIIPPENNPLTTTKTVSIIADNSAGTLVSDDVSGTPYTFGSVPQIQSVTPGPNKLTVLFSQANVGNTPSSYSYSFDPSGANPTAFDSSSTFIVNGSQPRTIYVIATNLAGSLISIGVSGTPFVVGDTPSIDDVVPGPYSLTVKFSQPNQGNTPVTYYYSYSVDGSNPQGPVYLPEFTVTATEETTIYVVADSSSGYIVSAGFKKTPFVRGTNPEIASIKPGTEILDVSFSQTNKGTEPVTYYYSFSSDGSGRIGPVISPFSISTTVERTVYIVASNPAGNLVSSGRTETPYTFANKPEITNIVPSAYNLNVQFTGSNSGTTPITYYYSFFSDGSGRIGPVTSPFNISGGIERTVYIVADNSAGFVVSTPGFTRAPYIYGTTPEIQSIVPGPNKITVTYSPSINGTHPVYHYYSYDPSGLNGTLIESTTFDIAGTSTRTVYIVANNIIGNLVSTGVSGTPFVVGNAPIIESVTSQTNNLRVRFSHPNPGNTAVTYYYSDDASGNNLIRQVNFGVTEPSYGEFDISGTVTRTIYVVSINSAGKLVSSPETATPFIFGTQPVIEYVNPGTEKLFVKFSQDQTGTTPVTYYYSFLSNGSNAIGPVDTSFSFAETVERTVYIVARNSAGNLVSAGVSGTPFVYGSKPVITGLQPGLNRLTLSFTQATTGTTPVSYYYSEYANGSNRVGPVTSPFDISNINTQKTIYIVADNSAGIVVSDPSSGTPYLLGTNPVVSAIVPGTNKLTVSFSQTSKGTEPVTYYYSELSNGTNRVGPVTSPFDISNILVSKTVYIIAENLGGTLISVSGETGTPYIFGSSPSITNVQPGTNSLTVNFNRSVGGTTPVTHYYSYDSSGVPRVAQIPSGASTFTITDISSAKTVYIVAENPAGNLVSVGASGTPYIFGDLPVISPITPGTNKLVVNFSQPNKGTLPVTYYYSFDGSGRLGTVTTPSFEIATLVSRTVYIIADNSAGTLVSAGVDGTPYIFGSALNVTLSSPISNTIRVSYNQATQGTTPTTYKYVLNGGSSVVVSTNPNGVFDISGLTSTSLYSFYTVASNAAGDLSSNTLTQPVLGIPPTISSVVPQVNNLRVNFDQSNAGTLPVKYYYSFDGITRGPLVNKPSFDISGTVSRTVYIIADNSAGTIVSTGVTGTPYIVGVKPTVFIESDVNKITVYFSNTGGTTPVTYYYSDASNGSNPIGPITSPFDISNITTAKTIYIVASNIAGTIISDAATGIPYTIGSAPVINSIRSGTNSLIVDFSGSTGGTPAPYAYYYSLDEGEYTIASSLTSPIIIDAMIEKQYTVTLIAQNSAGFTMPSNLAVGSPIYKQPIFNVVNASPPKDANADSGGSFAQDKSAFSKTFSPPPATVEDLQLQLQKNLIGGGRRSAEDVIRRKRVEAVGSSFNPTGGDFSIMETSPNVTRQVVFRR